MNGFHRTEGNEVITNRFMDNVMAPPFWRANLQQQQPAGT